MIDEILEKTYEQIEYFLIDLEAIGQYNYKIINLLLNKDINYKYIHEIL